MLPSADLAFPVKCPHCGTVNTFRLTNYYSSYHETKNVTRLTNMNILSLTMHVECLKCNTLFERWLTPRELLAV